MSAWMDMTRRQMGAAFDAMGLGPDETPSRVVAALTGARLRAYRADGEGPALLILPAPFKKTYLWDLVPEVSVVQRGLERGFQVFLLEWTAEASAAGLETFADRLPREALEIVGRETGRPSAILVGHSLGGTLAAIAATLHPALVGGLILIDAPLAFGAEGGPIAAAARNLREAGALLRARSGVSGSLVNTLSLAAAPEVFYWQRLFDFSASLGDPRALALHMRLERWALDESPLPRRLLGEIVEQLYRDDRFMAGTLAVGARQTGIAGLHAPVMAVLNPAGRIVPPGSMLSALRTVPGLALETLSHDAERGAMLQHLGPLVSPSAHRRLWPKILDWAAALGRSS